MAHALGFQPIFAPNIRQLVGMVEHESFAAKNDENSLGFRELGDVLMEEKRRKKMK